MCIWQSNKGVLELSRSLEYGYREKGRNQWKQNEGYWDQETDGSTDRQGKDWEDRCLESKFSISCIIQLEKRIFFSKVLEYII